MFEETETPTIFLSSKHVSPMVKRVREGAFPHLKNIVVMDEENLDEKTKKELEGLNSFGLNELISFGKNELVEYPEVEPNDICFFSYTSGTTGKPKGAMISHANIAAAVAGADYFLPHIELIHISYLPLAHVFERVVYASIIYRGGKYGLYGGNILAIKDDLKILQPTIFVSVPRMYNKFYDVIQEQVRELTGIKGTLARRAIKTKLSNHNYDGSTTHMLYDSLVFKKMRSALGGKVKYCLTGSAPISDEVRGFLKIAFSCGFAEGYGQTEAMAGEFVSNKDDKTFGHVGGCLPQNEFKLVDVPSMKYFSTDKDEKGRPAPRGEVWVRGANVIPGYYKNEEKTREAITEDRWLKSGDIGMIVPGSNALKIIDRVKNIFKLSQGEYIAPDKLEQAYKGTRGVGDIYVYGDSTKSVLIAIIYSPKSEITNIAAEIGVEGSYEELIQNEAVKKWFVNALSEKTREVGLKGFERIVKVHLTGESFEAQDLLTTTFKTKRHEAKEKFQAELDQMYVGLD